jgi:heterodisulfide reductase subunit A-like polyferredoxin
LALKELKPQAQITVLYRDMRTYGMYEPLYRRALELGVIFLRYEAEAKPEVDWGDSERGPRVRTWDLVLHRPIALNPDLLVLSMPFVPAEGSRKLASQFKVPVDMDGWLLEAHVKLRPVEFASEGVYLAGMAHYPKMLEEVIVQAQAAASRAATVLAKDQRLAGGAVAKVDPEGCVGCLTCVRVCPYGVPKVTQETQGVGDLPGAAYIEPSVCQGCGICVGACPAAAIELEHYRHVQVESEVLSLLDEEKAVIHGEAA